MEKTLAKDAAWTPDDLASPRVRLEVTSSIREGLMAFALLAVLLAITSGLIGVALASDRDKNGYVLLVGCSAFTVLVALPLSAAWWGFRESWLVDNDVRHLVRQRRLWAKDWGGRAVGFAEVAAVGVQGLEVSGKYGHWWGHAPVLALRDGSLALVGEMERFGFARATGRGQALATHLGVPFVAGSEQGTLVFKGMRGPGSPEFETQPRSVGLGCGPVLIGLTGLALIFLLAGASLFAAYKLRRYL